MSPWTVLHPVVSALDIHEPMPLLLDFQYVHRERILNHIP